MCASFRVFSLNFEGDKLSPWPFLKGTIPIAVRDWRSGAAWLKPWLWHTDISSNIDNYLQSVSFETVFNTLLTALVPTVKLSKGKRGHP